MFRYKLNVLAELKANGYPPKRLRDEKLLGEASIQKLRQNEMVGIHYLETICRLLQKQPGDIIEYQNEEKPEK